MQSLTGTSLARTLLTSIQIRVQSMEVKPHLVAVQVGEDPASTVYLRKKTEAAQACHIHSQVQTLPANVSEAALLQTIHQLNQDPSVDAILLQLPLPKHLSTMEILSHIDPDKDVDGLTPHNLGQLAFLDGAAPPIDFLPRTRARQLAPCTPLGIVLLLQHYGISLHQKRFCVVGRSVLVGLPSFLLLERMGGTGVLCHQDSPNLVEEVQASQVVVVCAGVVGVLRTSQCHPQSVVIDVGIHQLGNGSICGDVDVDSNPAGQRITPVPGGVGPMTVAALMRNTWLLASARRGSL